MLVWGSAIFGQVKDRSVLKIQTTLGEIIIHQHLVDSNNTPLIFLHGLFFDHHLWDYYTYSIEERNMYVIDMPLHGESINVNSTWDLQDCATMLIEILEALNIHEVHAVGHSWGGMTILRAAELDPKKFKSLTFFNTPFMAYSSKDIRTIKLQHLGLIFKNLFIKKASENIFATASLMNNPSLYQYFKSCMQRLSRRNIKYLNTVVRINSTDKLEALQNLKINHQIIVGKEDKIASAPPCKNIIYEEGGHTTPLEYPANSLQQILSIINK